VLVYPAATTRRSALLALDQIEFGGRQGFIKLALERDVPIVPVVAIGGQETALFLTRGERAAKLIGLDKLTRIKVLPVSIGPPLGVNLLDLPGAFPLPGQDQGPGAAADRPARALRRRSRPDEAYEAVTAEMQDALSCAGRGADAPVVG
jgi:hypothetical protein